MDDVEIVAFCDIIIERAQEAAKKYGTEDASRYTDYKELLKDESIEVVYVLTPNREHSFISIDALDAGKNVMCEKPMAKTYKEVLPCARPLRETTKCVTIGYQNRRAPQTIYAEKLYENGDLGEIYYAEALAIRRRAVPTWGVFLNEEEQGGGPL